MADDEKPTSIWKKEMSFRRKPAEEPAPDGSSEAAADSSALAADCCVTWLSCSTAALICSMALLSWCEA